MIDCNGLTSKIGDSIARVDVVMLSIFVTCLVGVTKYNFCLQGISSQ